MINTVGRDMVGGLKWHGCTFYWAYTIPEALDIP